MEPWKAPHAHLDGEISFEFHVRLALHLVPRLGGAISYPFVDTAPRNAVPFQQLEDRPRIIRRSSRKLGALLIEYGHIWPEIATTHDSSQNRGLRAGCDAMIDTNDQKGTGRRFAWHDVPFPDEVS